MLGWLDGLPAPVRDAANRTVFWFTYTKLEAAKAKLEAEVKGDMSGLLAVPGLGSLINDADGAALKQADLARIEGILQGMDAIKAVLGPPGKGQNGLPPVYLLGFDANNLGHAIVSIGDPGTARNVVTYVPGLGSGFPSTASGDLTRTRLLWQQAFRFDPTAVTCSPGRPSMIPCPTCPRPTRWTGSAGRPTSAPIPPFPSSAPATSTWPRSPGLGH